MRLGARVCRLASDGEARLHVGAHLAPVVPRVPGVPRLAEGQPSGLHVAAQPIEAFASSCERLHADAGPRHVRDELRRRHRRLHRKRHRGVVGDHVLHKRLRTLLGPVDLGTRAARAIALKERVGERPDDELEGALELVIAVHVEQPLADCAHGVEGGEARGVRGEDVDERAAQQGKVEVVGHLVEHRCHHHRDAR